MPIPKERIYYADFAIGERVHLKLDAEQTLGLVTAIFIRATGFCFEVSWADHSTTSHFAFELVADPEDDD